MIGLTVTCTVCGVDFTPAPDAFRRGTWRTCQRCRDGPGDEVPGVIEADSTPCAGQITRPKCHAERITTMATREQRQARLRELQDERIGIPGAVYSALDQDVPPLALIRDWAWASYIWDRPTRSTWTDADWGLEGAQSEWDKGRDSIKGRLALRADRKAQEARAERDRAAEDVARRTAEADQIKAELRDRFLRMPGTTPAAFEEQFPALLADHQRSEMQRLDQEGDRARQAMAAHTRRSL